MRASGRILVPSVLYTAHEVRNILLNNARGRRSSPHDHYTKTSISWISMVAMGRARSRWIVPCMLPAVVASGMPIASFFHSMFFADGTDAEGSIHMAVVDREGGTTDENGAVMLRRDFVLDEAMYSKFNEIGQAQYNILQQKGLDSPCWVSAAASIRADCDAMGHARKQRLAVHLSNCHMKDAGRKPTRCSLRDSDERCVEEMKHDDVAFQSFTTFFHHVNAICHHLSHSVWQEQTESLVRGLTASSLATFDRTEKSLDMQQQVLQGQALASEQSQGIADGLSQTSDRLTGLSESVSQELVSTMKEIQKQENVLAGLLTTQALAADQAQGFTHELGSAKSELAAYMRAIEEDRRKTRDQNVALADTIGFIHDCLDSASSAWARFQAFTYLILAANLCWVATSATPLRSARTILYVLVAASLLLERYLCNASYPGDITLPDWLVSGLKLTHSAGSFATATWTKILLQEKIRWLTFQACAVILAHTLVSYYVPCLAMGRLIGFARGLLGGGRIEVPSSDENDCSRDVYGQNQPQRRRRGRNGERGGSSEGLSEGLRHSESREQRRLRLTLGSGARGNFRNDGSTNDEGTPEEGSSGGTGGYGTHRGGTGRMSRRPPHELGDQDDGRAGRSYNVESGQLDGEGEGKGVGGGITRVSRQRAEEGGRMQQSRGGGRNDGSDDEDGNASEGREGMELADLSRQELQSLAKQTGGVVKANQSTSKIIRGLKDAGFSRQCLAD